MKRTLNIPLCDDDIAGLKTGDVFYLRGTIVTGRDEVHKKIIEEGEAFPLDLNGMAIYHAGPIVKETQSQYEIVSIGPTSSIRMEKWAADFIQKTNLKVMIGKGGMGEKTADACRKHKTVHCIYPGGCAVFGARQIKKIENVFFPELGMAECIWVMSADEFGPLIVNIDIHGGNLFKENSAFFSSNREKCIKLSSGFPF